MADHGVFECRNNIAKVRDKSGKKRKRKKEQPDGGTGGNTLRNMPSN